MKNTIKLKIITLGLIVSILAMAVSLVVSYFSYKNSLYDQFDGTIDKTTEDVDKRFKEEIWYGSDVVDEIKEIKEYVANNYTDNHDDPETFDTYDDKRHHYANKYPSIYALYGETFILYPALAEFLTKYKDIISMLDTSVKVSGAKNAFICYYDETTSSLVQLVEYRVGNIDIKEIYYPGSHIAVSETPNQESSVVSKYSVYGKMQKTIPIYERDKIGEPEGLIAYYFIEYDYEKVEQEIQHTILIQFATLGATSVVLIILYVLGAHFLIIRNINKLKKASSDFADNLSANGEEIKTIEPGVKSNDELRTLSNTFVSMENSLINYINVIKEQTITEQKMNAELSVASKIQLEALPNKQYDDKDISVRAYIQSAKEVGGDFYDYFYLDETHLAFCICDVSGKGVPASLFMMRGKELIKSKLLSNNSIENVLYDVNNSLLNNNDEGLFITAFVGVIDLVKDELTFVSAGHERPFIITNEGIEQLKCNSNFILSGIKDFNYKSETIPFKKGTTIFLHTDGLNEAINAQREEFGYERILSSLDETKNSSLDEKISNLNNKLKEFVGDEEPFDDETLLFVQNINLELDEKYENPGFEVIEDYTNKFNNMFGFLEQKVKYEFGIIFDELLNNVVSYEKADVLTLEVNAKLEKDTIILTVSSNGQEYNPLLNKDQYIDKYSDDLQVGGFGVTIIKNLVDSIIYNRKDGKNVLTLTKKI